MQVLLVLDLSVKIQRKTLTKVLKKERRQITNAIYIIVDVIIDIIKCLSYHLSECHYPSVKGKLSKNYYLSRIEYF